MNQQEEQKIAKLYEDIGGEETALVPAGELLPTNATSTLNSVLANFGNLRMLAATYHNAGCNPGENATVETALAKIMKGIEINIPPKFALDNIYIINKRTTCEGKLMAALILRAGGTYEVRESTNTNAEIVFQRKGFPDFVASFSMQDAKIAGLSEKTVWKKYPARMLYWRAFSIGANALWADVIGGMLLPEEISDGEIEATEPITIISEEIKAELLELLEQLTDDQKVGINAKIEEYGGIDYIPDGDAARYIMNIKNLIKQPSN